MSLQYRVDINTPPSTPQSQSCPAAPVSPAKYHFTCRKGFVNQKSWEILRRQVENCGEAGQNQPRLRRIASDTQGSSANPAVLPDTCVFCKKTKYKPETRTREPLRSAEEYTCVFCKKTKYKPETRTREPLRSAEEFRADKKVKESALLHIKCHTIKDELHCYGDF